MGYKLYRWIMSISLITVGLLQLFGDSFIGVSTVLVIIKFVLLAIAIISGFKYFNNKSNRVENVGKTE